MRRLVRKKAFSETEIKYPENYWKSYEHFAASFAVKEEFFKALRKGLRGNIRVFEVGVIRDGYRKPHITLHGGAKRSTDLLGANSFLTLTSHDA